MYDVQYKKNYDDKRPKLARIRFKDKAEATNTIKYLKSCTEDDPKPDSYHGGNFWVSELTANGDEL